MKKQPAYFLKTTRLVLKAPQLSDLDNFIALRSDPDVMKYVGEPAMPTREDVKKFLEISMQYQKKYGFGFCSVFEKNSGHFIGQAGLFHLNFLDKPPEIQIAYGFHKKFWEKGYATELVRALIQWGFEHLTVKKLVALTHPENRRSSQVLEKAGMRYTGKIKYDDNEVLCYEIHKNDAAIKK